MQTHHPTTPANPRAHRPVRIVPVAEEESRSLSQRERVLQSLVRCPTRTVRKPVR